MAMHTPHASSLSFAVFLLLLLSDALARNSEDDETRPLLRDGETSGDVKRAYHMPIYTREQASAKDSAGGLVRRGTFTGAIGLGDYYDVTYNVLLKIGDAEMPLVIDTGSSDLWAISNACTGPCAAEGIPVYPQSSFQSSGLPASLLYGDSVGGTHAFGLIGRDTAGIGGLTMSNQVFASINSTNTTVTNTESAGIFGLGFPINSVLLHALFNQQFPDHLRRRDDVTSSVANDLERRTSPAGSAKRAPRRKDDSGRRIRPNVNSDPRRNDPHTHSMHRDPPHSSSSSAHSPSLVSTLSTFLDAQDSAPNASTNAANLISTFAANGPLIARLVSAGQLKQPSATISLQRDTVHLGGNVGLLSIGELPHGVSNKSLTWVPIRRYSVLEGGLAGPPDSPNETYPIAWEVHIDNVFLDGKALPNSTLSPGINTTALIDTGSSLIRGPFDVVSEIHARTMGLGDTYGCSTPHVLTFQIGGKMFSVDPRDFLFQAFHNRTDECLSNVVSMDPPQTSFLYSWSLGDPFLKNVLASFYYGNLTHPSIDPPRLGLLSTFSSTTQNPAALLSEAINEAKGNKGNFVSRFESAPSGTWKVDGTGVGGVGLAATGVVVTSSSTTASSSSPATTSTTAPTSTGKPNGAGRRTTGWLGGWIGAVLVTLAVA